MPSGQFAYANLALPVTLAAGARYYLLSQEFGGGDVALLSPTNVITTTVAKIDGSAWQDSSGSYNYDGDNPNREREALDFKYQAVDGTAAVPMSVTFNPSAPVVANNSASGTSVTAINVTMSDGSQFAGTLNASPSSLVAISGSQLMLSRAVTPADDGVHTCSVTATENGSSVTGNVMMQVGSAPGQTVGTGFPYWDQAASGQTAGSGFGAIAATGTITLQLGAGWIYGYNGTSTPGTFTVQWMLDETPIGPQLTASNLAPDVFHCPPFVLNFDTTTIPDGTHMAWAKVLDHTSDQAYGYQCFGKSIIVHNSGFISGPQTVPASTGNQVRTVWPNRPDYVRYPGGGGTPRNTAQPWSYAFVPPAGGVRPTPPPGALTAYFLESINGPTTEEYHTDPVWSTLSSLETGTVDGGVWVQPVSVEPVASGVAGTSASQELYFVEIALNPSDGGRNANLTSSIVNLIEKPDGSAWYGVELQGRLYRLDHNGTVTTIAGFTKDYTKLSYNLGLGTDPANEALLRTRQTVVGNFDAGLDMGTAIDLCFDPRNTNLIYVCQQEDSCILKVDTSVTPAHVSLYAGTPGSPGYSGDGGPATRAQFDNCNSIIMTNGVHGPDPAGVMYVADTNNCVIRKITSPSVGVPGTISTFLGNQATRPTRSAVAAAPNTYSPPSTVTFASVNGATPNNLLPYPFTIRFNSTGDIIVFENTTVHVRRIWLSGAGANTVTSIGYFGGSVASVGDAWGWIAVDTAGAIGVVDDIIIAQVLSIDGGAENFWRLPITGGAGGEAGGAFGVGGLPHSSAEDVYFYHGWGHYPWAAAISVNEGRAIFNGVSDRGLHSIKIASTNDPMVGDPGTFSGGAAPNLNQVASLAGQYIWKTGTVAGRGPHANGWPQSLYDPPPGYPRPFPFNSRPSFTSIHGNNGNGLLGSSGRFSGASSFDEMLTTFPTEAALRTFVQGGMGGSTPRPEITGNDWRDLYYFIRINSVVGYTGNGGNAAQPGPDDPDTGNFPTITSISAVRNSATSITVNWTTDKPCLGFAACGTTAQQRFQVRYPVFSPIETPLSLSPLVYLTAHSATISQCPSGSVLHYTAVAKDMAGNSVHANDQVVPAYISPDGTQITSGSTAAVYNGFGAWSFGPVQTPPTGVGPPGPYGNFQYVKLNGKIVRNVPAAQAIRIDFGGNVFFLTTGNDRWWYQFVGYDADAFFVGSPDIVPASVVTSPVSPTTFDPPYTPSPDGTTISGGTGSLTTADGIWTFGAETPTGHLTLTASL